jgi:hypothetical protein
MGRYVLNDHSFNNYLDVGGWRGYAQRAAKDAFVTEARSWLEPLEKMLDAERVRLLALENATADDFLLFVAIRRDLSRLKHYLEISTGNLECDLTKLHVPRKTKTKRFRRTRRRI